jgi:hypothetical protein
MSSPSSVSLSYPIGKFSMPETSTAEQRQTWINEIAETPAAMRAAIVGLTAEQLEAPYRPGGWTVRQVIHHVPESHMNAYLRFKWALTEDTPTIKPYNEARWAETPDVQSTPLEVSLSMLELLHDRWGRLLRAMSDADYARTYRHPEMAAAGPIPLGKMLALYGWHGKHHVAHITSLRDRMGWK